MRALWVGLALTIAAHAAAQAPEADRVFDEATRFAEDERWAEAERAFERAFELGGAPSALFNRAVALRALGRYVAARDAFDALVPFESRLDPMTREVRRMLRNESAGYIAVLRLRGLDRALRYELRLDGVVVDLRAVLELDPGRHALRIERRGDGVFEWSGVLAPGTRQLLDVSFARDSSPWESGWLWAGIGAALLAAGTIVAVVVHQDSLSVAPQAPVVIDL